MVLPAEIINHFILSIGIFIVADRGQRLHGFPRCHDLIHSKLLFLPSRLHLLLLFLQITQINLHLTYINLLLLYGLVITILCLLYLLQLHLQVPYSLHFCLLLIIQGLL